MQAEMSSACCSSVTRWCSQDISKIFQEYSEIVFRPQVTHQLRNVDRVDVVWDKYLWAVLKNLHEAREDTRIPGNLPAIF